jgi:spore germination protein YaaH
MGMENNDLFREQSKRLRRIQDSTSLAVGTSGFKYYTTGTTSNVNHAALVMHEDTLFTSFKVNDVEQLTARGMSGVTFLAGTYLPAGGTITSFAISSGSVIAY